ncbi:MAG: hypothetical protein GY716_19070 [bacterium]|nr:hypothetical protein [bacterium]
MKNSLCLLILVGLLTTPGCNQPAESHPVAATEPDRPAPEAEVPTLSAEGPIVAQIDGTRVEGFKGWYENGVLSLYTGRGPWDGGQKIGFWHVPRKPDGQRIKMPAPEGEVQFGQLSYAAEDASGNPSTVWLEEFEYELQIGTEKDFLVEVALVARASGPVQLEVSGTIVAMTAGIKMTDGVVDRSFDHLDTIQWLTRDWIRERHQPAAIAERPDHCMMENASKDKRSKPRRQVAACSYLFTDEAGEPAIAKLWLEKLDGQWKEAQELQPEQLFRAHPIKPDRDRPPYVFGPLAAQRFEEKVYARQGGYRRISEPSMFPCGGGQKEGSAGWCEITYPIYPKDRSLGKNDEPFCQVTTYVFKQDAQGAWGIQKTLSTAQKFNRKTQQVEARESAPQHCG